MATQSEVLVMIPPVPGATDAVHQTLQTLVTALQTQAGPALAGVVLYGGLARGRYRAGRSDVNVAVVLHQADAATLQALAPALRDARRAAAVDAMLITSSEVGLAALDFPTKFLDIQRHHIVLHGDNPFAQLDIPAAAVQRRVAQSLRNMLLRLRQRYLTQIDEPLGLRHALLAIARPLAIELTALLHVNGHPLPEQDRTASLYALAAQAFSLDAKTLAELAALRDGTADTSVQGDVHALFARLLALLSHLADQADHFATAP